MDTKIFVLTHKHVTPVFKYSDIHNFMHTGAALATEPAYLYHDDINDNISEKNQIYSEMTGEYWIWKNMEPCDIIGFEHYRRHFPLSENEIKTILNEGNDIIVHDIIDTNYSIERHYMACHSDFDINLIKDIIKDLYPRYMKTYNRYIAGSSKIIPCNMFITYWDIYDKMMKFVFDILFEFEKRIGAQTLGDWMHHVEKYSKHTQPNYHAINGSTWQQYQLRICAFLAERLMTLWIYHNIPIHKIATIKINEVSTAITQN